MPPTSTSNLKPSSTNADLVDLLNNQMEIKMKNNLQEIDVISHPHPILQAADVTHVKHCWQSGETVRDILKRSDFDQHQEMVVILDDRLLTVAEWDSVCPQAGQIINAQAVVSGGGDDGGSNVGQILILVVAVVISIYAPQLGGAVGGFLEGVTGGLALEAGTWAVIGRGLVSSDGGSVTDATFKGNN